MPTPVLFLLAGRDSIAPADDCLEVAELLAAQGLPVETVVFEGVTHGFDQLERAPMSLLEFDPEATAEALRIAGTFLDGLDRRVAPHENSRSAERYIHAMIVDMLPLAKRPASCCALRQPRSGS